MDNLNGPFHRLLLSGTGIVFLALPVASQAGHRVLNAETDLYQVELHVTQSNRDDEHPDLHSHGVRKKVDYGLYHLQALVYDKHSGLLVDDARVYASVEVVGNKVRRKNLSLELARDKEVYCEYFYFHLGEAHRVRLDIHTPEHQQSNTVWFDYGNPVY